MWKHIPTTKDIFILTNDDSEAQTRPTDNSLSVGFGGGSQHGSRTRGWEGGERSLLRQLDAPRSGDEVPMIEKVTFAIVLIARRMRPYFQNHTITVRTNYPIFKILSKPDLVGRMIGWYAELSEFDIWYVSDNAF